MLYLSRPFRAQCSSLVTRLYGKADFGDGYWRRMLDFFGRDASMYPAKKIKNIDTSQRETDFGGGCWKRILDF